MKKLLSSFFLLMLPFWANAQKVQIDSIWYNLIEKARQAEVTSTNDETEYKGEVVIPETVEYKGVTYNVTSIGTGAFSDCYNLTSITIPNSVKRIGAGAFGYCYNLTSITIPNSVTKIENSTFWDCSNLTSITIPKSVTTIEDAAFNNCSNLNEIHITDLEAWCKIEILNLGSPFGPYHLYLNGKEVKELVIPNSVTSIREYAFAGCSSLTSITIPNSVTSIGGSAFSGCTNLTSITIPNSVTSIGSSAFSGCSSLTSITIPNSVTSIGYSAFYNCKKLTDVYCHAEKVPKTESDAFADSYIEYAMLHVPDSSYYDYKEAEVWKDFGTIKTLSGNIPAYTHDLIYMVDGIEYKTVAMDYKTNITLEAAPVKEGHTFSGWRGVPATMPLHDVIVTGSFTPNKYYLIYNVDGRQHKKEQVMYGDSIIAEAEPTKEGHTFSGWSEIPVTMPAKDVTIEGTFKANTYQVTYMVDGEVFKIDSLAYGTRIVNPQAPEKEKYKFSGWSETPRTMPANDLTITGSYTPLIYCETPTIGYKDGKLTFECATEGATCVTNITSDDFAEHVGREISLTLTYQVHVYAKAEGYTQSPVATATICWIECNHQSDAGDVEAIPATVVLIKTNNGIVTIEGLEKGTPVTAYTTTGIEMANGVAEEDTALTLDTRLQTGDIAIVRIGTKSVKVVMK